MLRAPRLPTPAHTPERLFPQVRGGVSNPLQDLCGGIEEVVRGFARRHDDLDRERLPLFVVEFDAPVVTKRLGFLLEIVGHGDARLMRELERLATRLKHYTLLVPSGGAVIERNKRWELEINADPERLMDAVTT
jgi:predicted transcriptional regulator of viral defense system